jgi:RNA polymerase sigma factor (sigma-70 family)
MSKKRNISEEDFEALLGWLGPSRETAGTRYETIRRSLIKIFQWRGFDDAENMADETMDRVARNVKRIQPTFTGDPTPYFYNVGNKLMMECGRRRLLQVPLEESTTKLASEEQVRLIALEDSDEAEYECLDQCLQKLKPDERALILSYYQENKQAKIDHRKVMAEEMGIDLNALRVRVYRIRARLEKCIEDCLGKLPE